MRLGRTAGLAQMSAFRDEVIASYRGDSPERRAPNSPAQALRGYEHTGQAGIAQRSCASLRGPLWPAGTSLLRECTRVREAIA